MPVSAASKCLRFVLFFSFFFKPDKSYNCYFIFLFELLSRLLLAHSCHLYQFTCSADVCPLIWHSTGKKKKLHIAVSDEWGKLPLHNCISPSRVLLMCCYFCRLFFLSMQTHCSRQHDCTSKNSMVGPLQYIWRYKMISSFYVYVLNNRKLGRTLPKIESAWTSLKTSILDPEAFVTEFKGKKESVKFNSLFAVRYQSYEEKQVK